MRSAVRHIFLITRLALLLVPALTFAAVPTIQSVQDSAGYGPRVAPGSLAVLFGTNLASANFTATAFPLQTSAAGASVSVGGTLAPLLYVSGTQINFQVPSSAKPGAVSLIVNGPGGTSAAFSFTVTAQAPSIYQYGTNHALAQNSDFSLNSDTARAAAGTYITVYLTGQGAVDNAVADGTATPTSTTSTATTTATATIGPAAATVQFLGLTPDFAGLAQANILVPNLPTGDYPLVITAGGYVSASAIVSVSGSGTAYTSPLTLSGSVAFANSSASTIALYNNVAYVCGANRIEMVDITNLTKPAIIGEFGDSVLNGNGDRCAINTTSGSVPFLVDIIGQDSGNAESFAVYSLNNPTSPALLTIATTPYSHMEDISFSGAYAFVTTSFITYLTSNDQITAQEGDFLVFSFANPAAPVFITTTAPNTSLEPDAEVVDQDFVYVASTTATGTSTQGSALLNVVNVSVPTVPSIISQVTIPQAAILLSIDVSGNTMLAAGNTTGQRNPGNPDFDFTGYLTLTALDLTNIELPNAISTVTTQLQVNGSFTTAAFTNGVFAIINKPPATDDNGPSSMMIVDARNTASLALYPFQTQFGFSGALTTTNGYLFAPTATGLNIYQLQL